MVSRHSQSDVAYIYKWQHTVVLPRDVTEDFSRKAEYLYNRSTAA